MIETIKFKEKEYPLFQANGNAAQFAIPFAKKVCHGIGYDIGCSEIDWAFPNAIPIDKKFDNGYNANNLPSENVEYIFSSHCLEHLEDWVGVLDYWHDKIVNNGVLFLYLPDFSQEYWRPWNNRKHINVFEPKIIKEYLESRKFKNIFVSGVDLNNSFIAIATVERE